MKRLGCNCHCDCGRCFASLAAFDAHRHGSFRDGTRHCVDPLDLEQDFSPITFDGTCHNGDSEKQSERTVWARRTDLARNVADAERLAALNAGKRQKLENASKRVPDSPSRPVAVGANPHGAKVGP